MDSAERAIRARLSLVDLILEVRVARVPASSAFEPLHLRRPVEPDGRQVYMLNKGDLAEAYETKKWMAYMKKKRTCPCIAVNSHKRESTKEGSFCLEACEGTEVAPVACWGQSSYLFSDMMYMYE
jgi:ribosome biogenesis GTPase A